MTVSRRALLAAAAGLPLARPALARATTVTITRQPAIIYIPSVLMERGRLVEAHAAKLGVPGLTTRWVTYNGGGATTDALLAGAVDIANTGPGNMLLLWDRTRGRVKGIVATCAQPLTLVSRDARIQSIADYRPSDRIAVPTVKVSTQSILLQIACVDRWGKDAAFRLDPNTVQYGHPDAMAAMLNPNGEIGSHFAAAPFQYEELKRVPGAHVVTDSARILGEPLSQAVMFTTAQFAEANPEVVLAVKAATAEATAMIRDDTRAAAKIYIQATGDPMGEDGLMEVLRQPGMLDYFTRPQGTLRFAQHLSSTGVIKTAPGAWTDYFLPVAADLQGS
ncbi:ABC transporter substrate-binding protein [Methylobacterium sp. NEAU 140]|uniref:ABC transporter substrate-binding protein n=1 Tax=Methylobacterium sp. NEAU 140 TaxID=3064945 RepID=UPI002733E2ED|nr:ABC transporter substrate-binding protein [Methylobacterium sp. NEAU 140]MDP4026665.1 ABC transporter substrate-binding protein [Methylobacterium sp. NEAU 140]